MSDSVSNRGLPLTTRGALVLAAFATALAFSIILPNLPSRIAAVSGFDDPATISRHAGLMSAAYTAAIFGIFHQPDAVRTCRGLVASLHGASAGRGFGSGNHTRGARYRW